MAEDLGLFQIKQSKFYLKEQSGHFLREKKKKKDRRRQILEKKLPVLSGMAS